MFPVKMFPGKAEIAHRVIQAARPTCRRSGDLLDLELMTLPPRIAATPPAWRARFRDALAKGTAA